MSDDGPELDPPPARGLVVRPNDDGFYVRLHPSPMPKGRVVLGVAALFGLLGGIIGWAMAEEPEVRAWIGFGSMALGVLLYGLSYGSGFFPIELIGDQRCLSWAGERYAWDQIDSCRASGGSLRLVVDGQVVAEASHLDPAAAAWTARLVTASLD